MHTNENFKSQLHYVENLPYITDNDFLRYFELLCYFAAGTHNHRIGNG